MAIGIRRKLIPHKAEPRDRKKLNPDVIVEQLDQTKPEAGVGPGFPITHTFKSLLLFRPVCIGFFRYMQKSPNALTLFLS